MSIPLHPHPQYPSLLDLASRSLLSPEDESAHRPRAVSSQGRLQRLSN